MRISLYRPSARGWPVPRVPPFGGGGDSGDDLPGRTLPEQKISPWQTGVPGLAAERDNSDFQNATWTSSSARTGYQGYDYATHAAGSGSDAFSWNLNIPQDGNYTVYVRCSAVSGAAAGAAYTVSYSGGSATVPVDQTKNTGTWVSLGKWAFTQSGTGQKVTLAENAGGTVTADAVKVVRDNGGVTNTAHHDFGYSYDPNGNLTSITDTSPGTAIGSYAASYDGLDRLTKVLEQAAGITQHTTTYGYDTAGNLTSRGHDAATSAYTYDPRNLLATETDKTSASDPSPQVPAFTFDPKGLLSHEVKPDGNTVDDTYFADGLLATQAENTSGATLVASHAYTYNPDGNKTQDTEKLMSADDSSTYLSHTYGYTYDPRDRIAAVTKDGTTTESYTHDASDNVTAQTVSGTTTTFGYDRNRLLTATAGGATADYNYDPSGRLDTVTGGGQILQQNTYDGFDHVVSHQQQLNATGGTDTTTYTYDPLDRKTAQTTGGKETGFAYLGLSSDLITESSPGPSPSPTTTPPAAPGCPRPPTTPMGRRPAATTPTTTTPTSKPSPDLLAPPPRPTATPPTARTTRPSSPAPTRTPPPAPPLPSRSTPTGTTRCAGTPPPPSTTWASAPTTRASTSS